MIESKVVLWVDNTVSMRSRCEVSFKPDKSLVSSHLVTVLISYHPARQTPWAPVSRVNGVMTNNIVLDGLANENLPYADKLMTLNTNIYIAIMKGTIARIYSIVSL